MSQESVARYREQGYLHVPQVLTEAEVKEFLTAALEQLDQDEKVSWDREDGNVMDWVTYADRKSEAIRRLALHPRITAIAEQLAGQPLRMFKSEILRKGTEGSTATPIHADAPAIPYAGQPVGLTAWVALTDVPVERGCMTFIPGSHLRPDTPVTAEQARPHLFSCPPELMWDPRAIVPLRAGDCTFHHEQVMHLAGPNHTDRPRVSLATVYMDANATFRTDALVAHDLGLEPGAPLNDERFPLIGSHG
ncbi:phytanoyl-CoA dioxygenase family protein [Streptomyces sp. GMR22]|uniref:phytanoyl-CoA dioxygenase family protein n=1 Tax=Streptomyces sp. GMR22 TaxID=2759524 RepID=UPI0015FB4404|nr:phytanoyl-CoA dioxygenase family protein [Streptomyces sp. GMR22]MBA6437041.1 phytanoyl-CoA dioxygenase family protein [Streptomyces sp. GMR22]